MNVQSLELSAIACIIAAGIYFLTGLVTGVWKYVQIHQSPAGEAHIYVDIAHRSSLMYSFAAILLFVFCLISALPESIEFAAVLAQLIFFTLAIGTYIIHGVLSDTDNQLKEPHKLGNAVLPSWVIRVFMGSLIVAEIGGFLVLFYGVLVAAV